MTDDLVAKQRYIIYLCLHTYKYDVNCVFFVDFFLFYMIIVRAFYN